MLHNVSRSSQCMHSEDILQYCYQQLLKLIGSISSESYPTWTVVAWSWILNTLRRQNYKSPIKFRVYSDYVWTHCFLIASMRNMCNLHESALLNDMKDALNKPEIVRTVVKLWKSLVINIQARQICIMNIRGSHFIVLTY